MPHLRGGLCAGYARGQGADERLPVPHHLWSRPLSSAKKEKQNWFRTFLALRSPRCCPCLLCAFAAWRLAAGGSAGAELKTKAEAEAALCGLPAPRGLPSVRASRHLETCETRGTLGSDIDSASLAQRQEQVQSRMACHQLSHFLFLMSILHAAM